MSVSKYARQEILPSNLLDHRAVQAWRRVRPDCCEPQNIEILKLKRKKSAVYRLTGLGSNGSAVIAKRCAAATASVERLIYETMLPRLSSPSLSCYGFVPEPESEFCWLFLEDAGAYVYSQNSPEHLALAGQWLATLHRAARATDLHAQLPGRGPDHYLQLLRSSRSGLLQRVGNPVLSADEVALLEALAGQCDIIEAHWAELESFCDGVPQTLVHGDFVVKNLRIQPGAAGPALLVYDWEMAGWGFPASDLAEVERCARPDLDAYYAILRQDLPQLDIRDIRRLRDYGNLLRVMDKVFWETVTMKGDEYKYLLKPLRTVRIYEPQMAAALRALGWSRHD
jgi:hypothetical protein